MKDVSCLMLKKGKWVKGKFDKIAMVRYGNFTCSYEFETEVCEIQTCRGDGCQRFDRGSMTETDAFREWLKEKHKE